MNKTWLWWGVLGVWYTAALIVTSDPTSFFGGIIVAGVALVLTLAWLVRLILAIRSGGTLRGQRLSGLGLEALVGVAFVGLCFLEVPQKVRFRLSEPALTIYAKEQLTHPTGSKTPVNIGLYQFRSVTADKDEVDFDLGGRFMDTVTFSYVPAPAGRPERGTCTPLTRAWYQCVEGW